MLIKNDRPTSMSGPYQGLFVFIRETAQLKVVHILIIYTEWLAHDYRQWVGVAVIRMAFIFLIPKQCQEFDISQLSIGFPA